MPDRLPKSPSSFLTKLMYICPLCQLPVAIARPINDSAREIECPNCKKSFPVGSLAKPASQS